MKIYFLKLVGFMFILISCSTTGSYIAVNSSFESKGANCDLEIIMPGQKTKSSNVLIGTFSVQEAGLSVICDWEDTLAKNKAKACESGADIIQFLEIDSPSISSTCYRSKANFLKKK
ncbi:MAG: hypothetical protein N4A33_10660 [Bacteriovoracaceae bacterium]|jgi:hypothetical protein|nr:hypothetical protein [Bacteriovoracaceae bacterium]